MKTKFVEYKEGESRSCGKCCHFQAVTKEGESCYENGLLCTSGARKDGRNGYFVEVKEKTVSVNSMIGKFVVIEAFGTSDEFNVKESDILGIFDTEKKAIDHICEDAKENFEADNEATIRDGEDWASNCLIVEIKRVVRPILTATVKCEVKDVVL